MSEHYRQTGNNPNFQRQEAGHTKTKIQDVRGLLKTTLEMRRQWSNDFRTQSENNFVLDSISGDAINQV